MWMTFLFGARILWAVTRSLEKIYMLKSVDIPEYYLGGNVEFLGETWKNQGLGLAISPKHSKRHY
jgi:hypothetical protein